MIPFTLSAIAPVLNAERVGSDGTIETLVTDSRAPAAAQRCLFVALKGDQFDAHDFAEQAVAAGATALLVNRRLPLDVPQLVVADTRRALGQLGAWVRQQVPSRVVALTGSSGKTSVKEMTAAILRQCGQVLATEGNFNNDIGVPLTLLRLTPAHDFAVIELGANHLGEIAWTTDLVRPETALVNNLSAAHLAGFGSLSGVAQAKGEIFAGLPANGRGILNADSHDWPHWQQVLGHKAVWRFAVQAADGVDFLPATSQAISRACVSPCTVRRENARCGYRCQASIMSPMPWPPAHWRYLWGRDCRRLPPVWRSCRPCRDGCSLLRSAPAGCCWTIAITPMLAP